MLEDIGNRDNIPEALKRAKDKNDSFRSLSYHAVVLGSAIYYAWCVCGVLHVTVQHIWYLSQYHLVGVKDCSACFCIHADILQDAVSQCKEPGWLQVDGLWAPSVQDIRPPCQNHEEGLRPGPGACRHQVRLLALY